MNYILLPDDPTMPEFLERQLVGDRLALVVSELAERPGAQRAPDSLFNHWDEVTTRLVLQHGLTRLTKEQLRQLTQRPEYLLQLQERVLLEGGTFWDTIPRTPFVVEAAQRVRRRVLESEVPPVRPAKAHTATSARYWMVFAASAAAIVVGLFLGTQFTKGPVPGAPQGATEVAWGWSKPGALPQDLAAPAYLSRLADQAAEWHNARPTEAPALAKRINELRANCSVLLLADHRPLAAADRDWLRERCRAWSQAFDQQLVALENGAAPNDVRAEMDKVVDKLTNALRQRASAVS